MGYLSCFRNCQNISSNFGRIFADIRNLILMLQGNSCQTQLSSWISFWQKTSEIIRETTSSSISRRLCQALCDSGIVFKMKSHVHRERTCPIVAVFRLFYPSVLLICGTVLSNRIRTISCSRRHANFTALVGKLAIRLSAKNSCYHCTSRTP